MSQPRISQIHSWQNYRRDIFLVIREALIMLQNQSDLPVVEAHFQKHSLNRELYACFKRVALNHNLPHHVPTPEGRNPASDLDPEPTDRETKIPDFYWQFADSLAGKVRLFILECKRLGFSENANWKLNENYIHHGIRRFITSPHEYGKDSDVCGMIGYIQSMEPEDILVEINICAATSPEPITPLQLSQDGWQERGVSELSQYLERPFPVSPFQMYHFWVDIRNK